MLAFKTRRWKEELKLSLFADDMILNIENPKEATRKLREVINEFGEVAGYKINAQKSLAFLYTNDDTSESESKKTLLFTITTKRIKYLGLNLPKAIRERRTKNPKVSKKKEIINIRSEINEKEMKETIAKINKSKVVKKDKKVS